jgi:hypothetical protein
VSDEIKVTVCKYGSRGLVLRYTDPETGKRVAIAAGTDNRKEAAKRAGVLEKELREGKHARGAKMPWLDFTFRYSDEVLPGLAPKTRAQVNTVFIDPQKNKATP